MKKLANFSFDQRTINLLNKLSEKYSLSKTVIVQKAIEEYADHKMTEKSNILNYAGTMSDEDADIIVSFIGKDRVNKDMVIEL